MANSNPSPKNRFKRGQVANPRGAGAHSAELKLIRKLTTVEIAEVGSFILDSDVLSLQSIAKDRSASALKVMTASIVLKAIKNGDVHALDVLLNRIVGKVKDKVELSEPANAPQIIITIPSNGREAPALES